MNSIGFIGAGNMGSAIIKGIQSSLPEVKISVFDPNLDKTKLNGIDILKCEAAILDSCKYVVLAVKPQILPEVLGKIKGNVTDETVLISICAGISGAFIETAIGRAVKTVLVMPNTPLMVGEGATVLSRLMEVTDEEFAFVKSIFGASGVVAEIPYDKMNEIICVNASSPAFIYLFAKPFIEFAEENGIKESAAKLLFSQALIGAAKMIRKSGYSIDELIKMVSSPGGTTLAGLSALYDGNFTETVTEACKRCTDRAYELSGDAPRQ
ncbi:MAG: pyrroline-5-carboxylate reductase [Ruminococcus sp.]|jgi:pyrroline-5-carboxylate reductase|nr:pyrroline-5-carboxylate reductase [Ruminococcus sp.]